MTGTISVAPAAFASAGATFGTARGTAAALITALAKTLDKSWGCAGTDTTGQSFAGGYDPAAFNAVASGADIVNGFGQLDDLLQYTSVNHANANSQAAVGANPADVSSPPPPTPHYETPWFKGSYGGSSDAPFGWGLITRWLQGRVWPNGHQDGLDALDSAWGAAADGLEGLAKTLAPARAIVDEQVSDEVPQILMQIDLVVGDINAAVGQFRSLGSACSDYAQALTAAHDAIGKALAELVIFAGVGAIVGSLIGPEGTAGGTVIAAGARGEAAAMQVSTAIDALAAAITPVRAALAGAAVAAGPITKNLQPLLEAKPTQFNTNTRPGGATQPVRPTSVYRGTANSKFNGEQAAQDVRTRLGSSGATLRNTKGVAVAQADINGQYVPANDLEAVSGQDPPPPGTLGEPTNPVFTPSSQDGSAYRPYDGEYKILDNIAGRIPAGSDGSGVVIDLYTEDHPCPACSDVIQQFQDRYPKAILNVTYTNPAK